MRSAETESSRSSTSASAPVVSPLASLRSLSPGTNSNERMMKLLRPPAHQRRSLAVADFLVALVKAFMLKDHDAGIGPRLAGAHLQHRALRTQGIADEDRVGEAHIVHAKVRYRGTQGGIADRNPDHQAERKDTVDQPLPELRLLDELHIEMQRLRIVGQGGEEQIVGFRNGARDGVVEHLADLELVKIKSAHFICLQWL